MTTEVLDRLYAALKFYWEAGKITYAEYKEARDVLDGEA